MILLVHGSVGIAAPVTYRNNSGLPNHALHFEGVL
jgi:hypothetical protein